MDTSKLPRCAVSGCENPAFVRFFGRFVCGDCVAKWYKRKETDSWEVYEKEMKEL